MSIVQGQILWLIIRLDFFGVFKDVHPYIVLNVDTTNNIMEIGQLHSIEGKEYEALSETNTTIYCTNPDEQALPEDSFLQLDNKITVELFPELIMFRRTKECLSARKLDRALRKYDS